MGDKNKTKAQLLDELSKLQKRFAELEKSETERKEAEDKLRYERQKFSTISENAPFGMVMIDADGKFTYTNPKFKELFGYDLSDVPDGETWFRKAYPDPEYRHTVITSWITDLEKAEPGEKRPEVFTVTCKDGTKKIIYFIPVQLETGEQIINCEDITERKRAEEVLESERSLLRNLIDNVPDRIYAKDSEGRFIICNEALARRMGMTNPNEIVGKSDFDFLPRELAQRFRTDEQAIIQTGTAMINREEPLLSEGGTITRWNLATKVPLLDKQGNRIGIVGVGREITDRKQAEEALKASEEKYRTILENIEDGYYEVDLAGNFTFFNDALTRIHKYSRDEMMGMNYREYTDEENAKIIYQDFNRVYHTGEPSKGTLYEVITKNGERRNVGTSISLIRDSSGKPIGFRGIARDITEFKRAEEAVRISEEKYRNIFENAVEGIFQRAPGGELISINTAMARIYGYASPEEMIKSITNIGEQLYVNPEDRARFRSALEEQGIVINFETQFYRKDGTKIWISISARTVKDSSGKILYIEGTVEDITSRKLAEEELRVSEELFKSYLEYAPDGVYMSDLEGNFLYGNRKCEEIIGYRREELIGKNFLELNILSENSLDKAVQLLQANTEGRATGPDEIDLISKEGRFIPVEINTNVVQRMGQRIVLSFVRDITSRKLAEEELKQTLEKLRKGLAGTIQAISSTIEARDPYTSGHQRRVSSLARVISQEMGLSKDRVDNIRMAGAIHDIGKLSVPAEILSKPTKLTDLEMKLIRVHPQTGYDILKDVDLPYPIAEIVLQHHERLNGSGYPNALTDGQILLEAQILAVADVVEAIASHRPYRPAHGIGIALEEIEKNRGILYGPEVVDVCLKLFREKGFQLDLRQDQV